MQAERQEQDAFFLQDSDGDAETTATGATNAAKDAAQPAADRIRTQGTPSDTQPAQAAQSLGKRSRTSDMETAKPMPAQKAQLQASAAPQEGPAEPAAAGQALNPHAHEATQDGHMQRSRHLQQSHRPNAQHAVQNSQMQPSSPLQKSKEPDNALMQPGLPAALRDAGTPAKRHKPASTGVHDQPQHDSSAARASKPKHDSSQSQDLLQASPRRPAAAAREASGAEQLPGGSGLHAQGQPSPQRQRLADDVFFDDTSDSEQDVGRPQHRTGTLSAQRHQGNGSATQDGKAAQRSLQDRPPEPKGSHPGRTSGTIQSIPLPDMKSRDSSVPEAPTRAAVDTNAALNGLQPSVGSHARLARLQALADAIQRKHQPDSKQLGEQLPDAPRQSLDMRPARGTDSAMTPRGGSESRPPYHGSERSSQQAGMGARGSRGRGGRGLGSSGGAGMGRGRGRAAHLSKPYAAQPGLPQAAPVRSIHDGPDAQVQEAGFDKAPRQHVPSKPYVLKQAQAGEERPKAGGPAPVGDAAPKGRTRAEGGRKRRKKT